MKQGKVFEKLQARKNVQGITFQDKTCTVILTDGRTGVCKTAHEARLFIEGKFNAPNAFSAEGLVGTKITLNTPLTEEPTPTAKCGTEARTIVLDADWLRVHAGDLVNVPRGVDRVRVTVENAAILLAGCSDRYAGF
jgi:hypothetical protein